ncbi:hypothetical protein MRB53_034818 [Persea americana]|uniref:Uncharacterized protein n=1 Tax=Persea americana TaxID=3435 RepID=A0ACC2K2W0_PERAE|nr:hypothetical protein MRB53_034818 [Persea americana]
MNAENQKRSSSSSAKMGRRRRQRVSSGEESSNPAVKSISLLFFRYAIEDGIQGTLLPLKQWQGTQRPTLLSSSGPATKQQRSLLLLQSLRAEDVARQFRRQNGRSDNGRRPLQVSSPSPARF